VDSLQTGVVSSPADALLSDAIAAALQAPPGARAELLLRRLSEIQDFMAAHPEERPWTFTEFTGTDGSRIFRGGTGHSLVIDPDGALWRARSYEDFDTAYTITPASCEIASLTPRYAEMRQYLPRTSAPS
jgi:hypothetical protein